MNPSAQTRYGLMRASMQLFNKPHSELNTQQRDAALQQVNREHAISKRLLDSVEAELVVISDTEVDCTLQKLCGRFASEVAFEQAIKQNGLDRESLRQAIAHELRVEAATELLLGEVAEVDEKEVEIYYYEHIDKFSLPESRTAYHLLLTINDDYPENAPQAVKQRMWDIMQELKSSPEKFHELASRHSECPTAMHGGMLGRIKQGQLYPELDHQLFTMIEGEISEPVQSPLGWHILLCETIHPSRHLPFTEVKERLQEHLSANNRRHHLMRRLQQSIS